MAIDADATLQSARNKLQAGEFYESLADYEAVIRANAHLDAVASDLNGLLANEKAGYQKNAPVHRVLGDALMRLGRLQEALDTYRKALNLL